MDTLQLIRQFLSEQYGIAPESVTPEAQCAQVGIDSLAFLELIFEFESKYQIPVPSDNIPIPATISELVALVDQLVAAKKS
jgi:acyl carrier protein